MIQNPYHYNRNYYQLEEKYKGKYNTIKTKWLKENFKSSNDIMRNCMTFNAATGQPMVDAGLFRDSRIKTFMKEWDVKDKDDYPIALTPEKIDSLKSPIANALLNEYDRKVSGSEEELGN